MPGTGLFSIQAFSRHAKSCPCDIVGPQQRSIIRACVISMLRRIAATSSLEGHGTHDRPPAVPFQPLRATAFVETRDFPPEVLLYATRELMNALMPADDRNSPKSPEVAPDDASSSSKQSSPEVFDEFYRRTKLWKLKRETQNAMNASAKQQEAVQCTFAPVVLDSSAASCFLRKAEELREAGKAEGKRIQQQIKERSGDPFRRSAFQRAKPLPGRPRKIEGVTSHVSRYLESARAEKSGSGADQSISDTTIRVAKKSP